MKGKTILVIVLVTLALGAGFMGYRYYQQQQAATK